MFGKLFSKKKPPQEEVFIIARLNDKALPLERGSLYEDPLDKLLKENNLGEVSGGGTMMSPENEIEFCEVEILIKVPVAQAADLIKTTLERLGAPLGSKLILESEEGKEIPLGTQEGLAVYLNGTDLPDEVYKNCDSNFVIAEFTRLLGSKGKYRGHWQGPKETGLYMYGKSFEEMGNLLKDFLETYPLCQKSRVVRIA